jgi:hypothetical protein
MEALVWNTRSRTQRGVEVAGNFVGLLNGEIPSIGGRVGVGLFTNRLKDRRQGRYVSLGHVGEVFREPIRGFHD